MEQGEPTTGSGEREQIPIRAGRARKLLFGAIAAVLGIVFLEGLASLSLFGVDLWRGFRRPIAENQYTKHDRELGWVSLPNQRLPDLYGPGIGLSTNGRGFRGSAEVADDPAPGKIRVICCGDSFTFGYGVRDEEAWPYLLGKLDPRLETINLGQGGYGIDQAYLWYRRDGLAIGHQIVLFSFIDDDFARMCVDKFNGYAKPLLKATGGGLRIENVPTPVRPAYVPWLTQNEKLLRELGLFDSARRMAGWSAADLAGQGTQRLSIPEMLGTAMAVFEDLRRLAASKGAALVLVYLPRKTDYDADIWLRKLLSQELARLGFDYLDMTTSIKDLPNPEVQTLFLSESEVNIPGAAGHYSVKGNAFMARALWERLRALPAIQRLLESTP